MVSVSSFGSFDKTESFLHYLESGKMFDGLDKFGRQGVDALSSASPVDTGLLSESWGYQIGSDGDTVSISWYNTDIEGGLNIAIIVQYGHGTGTGGWVEGRDYINPAIQPIFDRILDDVWRQVTNA